jgi:hypothetical protein
VKAYKLNYENGDLPIGDLPIGARVVDPSWGWEFRTGENYSGSGPVKPVTWIVVAKNHYGDIAPHVTLLAESLIGKHNFDKRDKPRHEGDTGSSNSFLLASLRNWLNSADIHSGEGFYHAFSGTFQQALLITTLPNKDWQNGSAYSTSDKVFIPSATELGDTYFLESTYQIGSVYYHFQGASDADRIALLDESASDYWTRSPNTSDACLVFGVKSSGEFAKAFFVGFDSGVRPAVNLKSEILVSEASSN